MRATILIAALAVLAGATAAVQPAQAQTDDHGNTREEATPLELGVMQTGEINPDRENDYFRIVVSDFVTLTVDITRTSGTQDLEVDLENSAGSSLEAIFGSNIRLQRQVSPGTYYIRVSIFLTGSYTIHADISAERTVSIVPGVAFVAPGASQLLTVQVHPPDPLPATARLTITTGGTESGNINNAPATVDIPAGEIAANFSINLAAGETTANNRSTVSISNAVFLPAQQTTTVTVADLLYTLSVDNTADTFTLIVGTQPDGTVNICNRTPEVRDAILTTVRNASPAMPTIMCQAVPETRLLDITALNLIGNNLTALQNGDFANLPRLESLELGRNSLALLPVNVFDGLSTLTRLNLGTNQLESLPAGLFADLSALEGLALDNNHLHLLDENLFAGLSNLQNLVLNRNNLQSPPAGLFNGLSRLQSLDLRFHLNNPLTLPAGLFNDVLDMLMTLLLDSRHRARVFIEPNVAAIAPNSSHNLTVRLSTSLPVDIRLPITASGNAESFLTLPATVTVTAGMTTATFNINLAGATAGDTGTIMLSTPRVTYTNTSGTLRTISQDQRPGVFNSLVNTLNIDRNTFAFSVSSQPDTLVNICDRTTGVKIDIFDEPLVTETDCTRVPQTQLNTITRLDLERRVSDVEVNDFAALSNLENLNLRDNNLPSLHENVFDGLSTLRYLNLSDNNLESLPAGLLDGLSALRHLFLDHNRLTLPLPPGLFNDVLDTLTDLRLHNQANDVDLRSTVSIEPSTATIAPGRIQTLTAQLAPPSPATVRLTILAGGNQAGNITLPDSATVTIPAGMMSADFDITLTGAIAGSTGTVSLSAPVLLYTGTNGEVQETTVPAVVNSLVNPLNTALNTHAFTVHSSPTATFKAFTAQSGGTEVTGDPIPITEGSSLFVRFALSRPLIAGETLTQVYSVASDGAIDADLRLGGIRDDNNSAMFTIMGPTQIETHEVMAISDGTPEGPERFQVKIVFTFQFKGKSGLLHTTPPGILTRETSLNFEIQDAAPNPSIETTARLTRNRASVTEGVSSSSGVFTLTLADAPNGPATVTYIIKVTGATPNDNDISTSFTVGTTDTHVTTVTDGSAGINIAFIPESDADNTDETVTLTIISIEFTGFTLGPNDLVCPVLCPGGALDITITDNRLPTATLTRDRDSVTEGANDSSATFTLALTEAPDDAATVTYTLGGGLGTKYTAALDGGSGENLSDTARSVFIIPEANITGTAPGVQGGAQGSANVIFTITPLPDDDTNNEVVTLTIHSIEFDNDSDHGNLAAGDIGGTGITNGAQTLTIIEENALQLRIRMFLEGALQ